MRIGISADHGGFLLKEQLITSVKAAGFEVEDFGAFALVPEDDYPDYGVPLAEAVARGKVEKGIAICGSGVGICVASNKVHGARAGLCHDNFSARQGVEDDDMNVLCLGSRIIGYDRAWELVQIFLAARFSGIERHKRRLAKVIALEQR